MEAGLFDMQYSAELLQPLRLSLRLTLTLTLPLPLPLPLIPTLTPHQVSSACSTSEGGYLAGDEFSTADACLLPFLWRIEQVGVGIGVGIKYVRSHPYPYLYPFLYRYPYRYRYRYP